MISWIPPYTDQDIEQLKADTKKYLEKAGEALKGTGFHTKYEVAVGDPAKEIVDYADEHDIGLIIMATHGRSGIKRWAIGSVADKVARYARQPVMIIRAKSDHRHAIKSGTLKKIIVPLDGSPASEAVIPYIGELADKLKAEVILFQAMADLYHLTSTGKVIIKVPYTEKEIEQFKADTIRYLEKVGERLKAKGISTKFEVTVGDPAEEIINLADKTGADLVAMSTHGRSGIARWALGSVADKVLHAGNTPLLLVRASGAQPGSAN
jgi:nucleotide-binding universal stress UspA family protein